MIDHVSIPVSDLQESSKFYEALLSTVGHKKLVDREDTVGFGKKHPEFWLNHRPNLVSASINDGFHICLRASSMDQVNAFHTTALELGARSDGTPGYRPEYHESYYAAFIKDKAGNRIEVVTFVLNQTKVISQDE